MGDPPEPTVLPYAALRRLVRMGACPERTIEGRKYTLLSIFNL
jgi:hypothetical protein